MKPADLLDDLEKFGPERAIEMVKVPDGWSMTTHLQSPTHQTINGIMQSTNAHLWNQWGQQGSFLSNVTSGLGLGSSVIGLGQIGRIQ